MRKEKMKMSTVLLLIIIIPVLFISELLKIAK